MRIAVVCCSLNPESRSAALAQHLREPLARAGADTDWIDLRDHPLPLCDGGAAYGDPAVAGLAQRLARANAVILATPVYNFDVNAAAKNLIELTGRSLTGKVVGLICSAGGRGSYMSATGLVASLMLDFRCWVVPRFVYADDGDFGPDAAPAPAVTQRIDALAHETARAAAALPPAPPKR